MQRIILDDLKKWLNSEFRKPAVLRGARQVGKTWLVRELAKQADRKLIEINFEERKHFAEHFVSNDPKKILLNLESILNLTIDPGSAILFLDEIQVVPEMFAVLRWFYEKMPNLAVIAAGSLLEFTLDQHQFSMPVGRIQYFFVEPLGFEEFLAAKNEKHLLSRIQSFSAADPFNSDLHEKASSLFKEYMIVGGMPEAINAWIKNSSLEQVAEIHNNLLNTYQDDFAKYKGRLDILNLESTLFAIPKCLGKKFVYSHVDGLARNASIKHALELLTKARICHSVQCAYANGIPIKADLNPKNFKMIFLDIGLALTMLGLKLYQFQNIDEIIIVNNGALAEQVVGQLLRLLQPAYMVPDLYYWARDVHGASAEVDYLIQNNQSLIPIEVKAGSSGTLRSLHQLMSERESWQTAVRIYSGNAKIDQISTKTTTGNTAKYQLISLPFYLISQINRLI